MSYFKIQPYVEAYLLHNKYILGPPINWVNGPQGILAPIVTSHNTIGLVQGLNELKYIKVCKQCLAYREP